jgi:hypothetical protein
VLGNVVDKGGEDIDLSITLFVLIKPKAETTTAAVSTKKFHPPVVSGTTSN